MSLATTLTAKLMVWGVVGPTMGVVLLVIVYPITFGAAVLLGTRVASNMKTGEDMPKVAQFGTLTLMVGLLAFNAFFFGGAAKAAYNLSPVLKCQWAMVDGSMDFGRPTLRDPSVKLGFAVTITNPTERTAKIGAGAVVNLFHNGDSVATTDVPAFEVGPGETVTQHIALKAAPKGGVAKKGLGLLGKARKGGFRKALWGAAKSAVDRKAYRAALTLPLPTGDLTISLYDGSKKTR
jgi:hypothetical protein